MKYKIWNGVDTIYTPGIDPAHGRMDYTSEEWKAKYSWTNIPGENCVIANGTLNGAFCMPLSQMVSMANQQGAEIDTSATPEEQLVAYEVWEQMLNTPSTEPSTEERTAAALEFIAMSSMPDEVV